MIFTIKAQFLKAYVQHYINPDSQEKTDYYKVTIFTDIGFDKSPNLPITEEAFKTLGLDNEKVQADLRNRGEVEFECDLSFYNNKTIVNITGIKNVVKSVKIDEKQL